MAVRRGDGDGDACIADLDAAGAMRDGHLTEVVFGLQRVGEVEHHPLGHAFVGLVLEVENGPAS